MTKTKTGIPSIHEKSSCIPSCIPKVFNAGAGWRVKVYQVYTKITKKHYLVLGGVIGYTYNHVALPNINAWEFDVFRVYRVYLSQFNHI